jgi:amino acid transporter
MSQQDVSESDRLSSLGYKQELSRVLSLFDNFSVAFSYLSPMVGIYSLYALGLGTGGPRYIWTMPIVVGLMLLVAMVFGELASEYPLSGALYQYGKYNVGARYGWYVGWIYGFALLATVASVDSGAVGYVADLSNIWFKTHLDPANHVTIFAITGAIIVLSAILNSVGAKLMGRVARLGVYVETIGTFGVFLALAIHGFTRGFGFLFTTQGVEHSNAFAVNFGGHWWTGAALVAVLANVYIFYGFESAGDISEETVDAHRQVPKAMRNALLYGGVASFVLVLGLLLATPKAGGIGGVISGGGPAAILAVLPSWLQDFFLVMVIIAFFSCGTAVQGAGARVAFALARDGAVPGSNWLKKVSKHKTPANAILVGTVVPFLFLLLVLVNPSKNYHILWFDYPAHVNALYALVSFGVSGIYLSFFLTVLGAFIARRRGWKPSGSYTLGKWGNLVTVGGLAYLGIMLINVLWPSALTSGRGLFNYGWITLLVMVVIVVIGGLYEMVARPDKNVSQHRIENN